MYRRKGWKYMYLFLIYFGCLKIVNNGGKDRKKKERKEKENKKTKSII
jgi:hypothetical protein